MQTHHAWLKSSLVCRPLHCPVVEHHNAIEPGSLAFRQGQLKFAVNSEGQSLTLRRLAELKTVRSTGTAMAHYSNPNGPKSLTKFRCDAQFANVFDETSKPQLEVLRLPRTANLRAYTEIEEVISLEGLRKLSKVQLLHLYSNYKPNAAET